jgi:adenylate cyclase
MVGMLGLRTVRAKLTSLVLLSGVVLLAALPILYTIEQRQLVDEADDRAVAAERSFEAELEDSLADLRVAAAVIAADSDTRRALAARDAHALGDVAALFAKSYPALDILFITPDGSVIAQLGCQAPPKTIGDIPELGRVMAGATVQGMTHHGCEASATAPPSYMIATPVDGGGAVVVCLPVDVSYLANAGTKFGLELALVAPGADAATEKTPGFPEVPLSGTKHAPTLLGAGAHRWAVSRLSPRQLRGPDGAYSLAAGLDVTRLQSVVRASMIRFALLLLAAGAISVAIGWRLASVMVLALRRVNSALKKLEQQEYVHVEVRTGDELEDLASGFNTMVDGLKERDKLRATFGKYMTASVMEHLLSGKVQLGGTSIKVTILFTDIRGFTTMSEHMEPQAVVALLNEYFTEMVQIVMKEDGVVDKYIGDAIMAVFGAPVPKRDDAINALRAAVRMRHALAHLNERLVKRGIEPIRTGIGIHTGEVVAGNIGSETRMEYTVIGDAVNLASRLESATKEQGVAILISEDTYKLAKDAIEARPVKEIHVKGRAKGAMTYEVLGLKGEQPLPLSEGTQKRVPSVRPAAD